MSETVCVCVCVVCVRVGVHVSVCVSPRRNRDITQERITHTMNQNVPTEYC